jgi:two-component system cell cycle sensor histidine kinase/response regulator CckA
MSDLVDVIPPLYEGDPVRRALDSLQEGFQVIGFDWKYIYLNPAAARHGRRDSRELNGKAMTEAYPGIDRTPLFEILRRAMEERTTHVFENQFTFPDGTMHWFEVRVQPVPEGICIYSSDIEARKRRELAVAAKAEQPLVRRISRLFRRSGVTVD